MKGKNNRRFTDSHKKLSDNKHNKFTGNEYNTSWSHFFSVLTIILLLSTVHSANLKVLDSLKSKILDSVDSFSINHINVFLTVKPSSSKKNRIHKISCIQTILWHQVICQNSQIPGSQKRGAAPLSFSFYIFTLSPMGWHCFSLLPQWHQAVCTLVPYPTCWAQGWNQNVHA